MPQFTMIGYGITRKPATIRNMKPAEVECYTEAANALIVRAQDTPLADIWAKSKEVVAELFVPLSRYREVRGLSTSTLLFKTDTHRYLLRVADESIKLRKPKDLSDGYEAVRGTSDALSFMLVKDAIK